MQTIKIVTIHGTNDADLSDTGERWWQRQSAFHQDLERKTSNAYDTSVEIMPFHWSGENSETARVEAAQALVGFVGRVRQQLGPRHRLHFIAHSHGGNVLLHAIHLDIGRKTGSVDTFTCIGTPFFRTFRRLDLRVYNIMLYVLLITAAIFIAILLAAETVASPTGIAGVTSIGGFIFGGWVWLLYRRRRHSWKRFRDNTTPILCIWSERDEAIRGLAAENIARLPYVTSRSVALGSWRALRFIITFGVLVAIPLSGLGLIFNPYSYISAYVLLVSIVAILSTWLFYFFIFGVFFTFGISSVIANAINLALWRVVVSSAYGDDHSMRVAQPSPIPWNTAYTELKLTGDSVGSMSDKVARSTLTDIYDKLMAHSRTEGTLVSVWSSLNDALYHNAYFQDARVIQAIAANVCQPPPSTNAKRKLERESGR